MKTNILFIIRQFGLGGTERRMHELHRSLSNQWDTKIYSLTDSIPHSAPLKNKKSDATSVVNRLFSLFKTIKSHRPQIIVSFDLASSLYVKLLSPFLENKIKYISGYGSGRVEDRRIKWLLSRKVLQPDYYVCNSQKGADVLKKHIGNGVPVHVIRNGLSFEKLVHLDNMAVPAWSELGRSVVGYIGKLNRVKHGERMFELAEYFKEKKSSPIFVIIGGGEYLQEYKERISKNPEQYKNVRLLGPIPNAYQWARYFDIGVLCSDSEGLPNVILEYMALGVPCVSTNVGDVDYILGDNEYGRIIDVYDKIEFTENIEMLLHDDELREKYIGKAKKRFHEHFSVERMATEYESLFLKILGKKPIPVLN